MHDNTCVKVAIPIGDGIVPIEYIHSRQKAIGGGSQIGIVDACTIMSFGLHRVVAKSATAVVVHLEVAAGFINAVAVEQVMGDVVLVEQIAHGREAVSGGSLGQVEARAATGARTSIRDVVGVHIAIGVNVVAFSGVELCPRRAIGIMPTKGGGGGIGGIID